LKKKSMPDDSTAKGAAQPKPASRTAAAQADLLGEATPLKPPAATETAAGSGGLPGSAPKGATTRPKPADDENQAGFIGERNVPHP
jgi:hypothetical protein